MFRNVRFHLLILVAAVAIISCCTPPGTPNKDFSVIDPNLSSQLFKTPLQESNSSNPSIPLENVKTSITLEVIQTPIKIIESVGTIEAPKKTETPAMATQQASITPEMTKAPLNQEYPFMNKEEIEKNIAGFLNMSDAELKTIIDKGTFQMGEYSDRIPRIDGKIIPLAKKVDLGFLGVTTSFSPNEKQTRRYGFFSVIPLGYSIQMDANREMLVGYYGFNDNNGNRQIISTMKGLLNEKFMGDMRKIDYGRKVSHQSMGKTDITYKQYVEQFGLGSVKNRDIIAIEIYMVDPVDNDIRNFGYHESASVLVDDYINLKSNVAGKYFPNVNNRNLVDLSEDHYKNTPFGRFEIVIVK